MLEEGFSVAIYVFKPPVGRQPGPAPTSRYRGVYWDGEKQLWRADIEVERRRYRLGRYESEEVAALAYDAAAERLGVPERCNYVRPSMSDSKLRECRRCSGLGLVGGEWKRDNTRGRTYVARIGKWRDCPACAGAGYLTQVFEAVLAQDGAQICD